MARPAPQALPPKAPARRGRRIATLFAIAASLFGIRALLRSWPRPKPLPPQGWGRGARYHWRGHDVHFQRIGEGSPLVLVHSLGPGHDSDEWERAAELLGGRWEVIAPDLPGWGLSPWWRGEPSPGVYVDFLSDFLREVVRRPAALVAAGGAAPFAVSAAAKLGPEHVSALALVGPRGLPGDADAAAGGDALLRRAAGVPALAPVAAHALTTRRAIQRHLESEVFAAPERADAARRERCYRSSRQPGARNALTAWLGGGLDLPVRDLLPALRMPVWLAWGRQSAAPVVETADRWVHALPQAGLEVFDSSGALPHVEATVPFCRALAEFLESH
jgi:pimeloyl-ACP methyl ester carboxylesterase